MIPLATATFPTRRPIVDDAAELPTGWTFPGDVRGHLSTLSQYRLRPGVDAAEMVLLYEPSVTLQNGDLVTDPATGIEWTVLSVDVRTGLGLDHHVAAVRRTEGHDG